MNNWSKRIKISTHVAIYYMNEWIIVDKTMLWEQLQAVYNEYYLFQQT